MLKYVGKIQKSLILLNKSQFFSKIFSKFKQANNSKNEINQNLENITTQSNLSIKSKIEGLNSRNEIINSNKAIQEKSDQSSIERINAIYKSYNKNDLLKKDNEFGEVTTYSDFLDKGTEKFDNLIVKYYHFNRELENNKEYVELMKIVSEKYKKLYTNYKEEYKYELMKYEERWYKEAIHSKKKDITEEFFKEEDYFKKTPNSSPRNPKEEAKIMEEIAYEPHHPKIPFKKVTPFETYTDHFDWVKDPKIKETRSFCYHELLYSKFNLFRYTTLEYEILKELLEYENLTVQCPVQMSKNLLIYKKSHDNLTLYCKDPISLPPENRGNYRKFISENESESIIFGLRDFLNLNKAIDNIDINILDFTKKLLDKIENEEKVLIDFFLCPNERYLVLVIDFFQDESKSVDLLIKDIKSNILFPIILHNSDGEIAFDKEGGIYFTEVDITGRGHKVFRHSVGSNRKQDVLIYHEKNPAYKIKTYNCISKDYIYIEISTIAKPENNEIWLKSSIDTDKTDFICLKKMDINIKYSLKYANGAFFMHINKLNSYDQELKKLILTNKNISGFVEYSPMRDNNKEPLKLITYSTLEDRSTINYNQTTIEFKSLNEAKPLLSEQMTNSESRDIVSLYEGLLSNNKSLIKPITDIIKADDDINIIDFEVFNNYLVVLEETNQIRHFKVLNFKTNKSYTHEPFLNHANVNFVDNYFDNSQYFRYMVSSPIDPFQVIDYSMGTRKDYSINSQSFQKFHPERYKSEIIYIEDRNREVKIPVQLFYNTSFFTDESPYIFYSKGAEMDKNSLNFRERIISLLDRGFVWAVPQVRGTKFFNFDWYSQGASGRKLTHFTDFLDCVKYFKNNKISDNIILFGEGYSGGLTGAVSFIQEPELFNHVVLYNGIYDLFDYLGKNRDNISLIEEFGDIYNKSNYDLIKMYSPYHLAGPDDHPLIMVAADENEKNNYHTLKFIAKLRMKNKILQRGNKIYLDLMFDKSTIEEKYAFLFSSIVGNTYINP